jgi:hypothetical protein
MYRNCMFCQKDLGENQAVEHFPIGRRLAFDSHRGRLWVVCRKCERWNLTPMEERWEAVEECERLFRETRIRTQTENIGLAKLREGLTLVRVGEPLRDEFAAWRYGDQFGRRRTRNILIGVGVMGGVGALTLGAMAAGISVAALGQTGNFYNLFMNARTLTKVKDDEGRVIDLKRPDLQKARLVELPDDQGWGIRVVKKKQKVTFSGEEARDVAGRILPHINYFGGKKSTVQDAVSLIEEVGHPEELLRDASRWAKPGWKAAESGVVSKMPAPQRLALEMALHEEQERRALEGELWLLEQAWQQAEEIAEIADGLLLPDGADRILSGPGDERAGPSSTTS